MFFFGLINLTITCNELLWSNSISFSFLFIFFSYKGNKSESKYYFFLNSVSYYFFLFPETAVYWFVSMYTFRAVKCCCCCCCCKNVCIVYEFCLSIKLRHGPYIIIINNNNNNNNNYKLSFRIAKLSFICNEIFLNFI